MVVQTDVSRAESVRNAVKQIRSDLGQITVLAYNASGYGRGGFLEVDPKAIQQSFEVGVMGAVYRSQAVIPDMLTAGHGFIRSPALRGLLALHRWQFAKASSRMFGQSLASEFHPKGIHVVHGIVDGQINLRAAGA